MTITSAGHQRETRPRLRNHHGNSSDDPKSDAAPQHVTKIDAVLSLQSPTQHLTTVHRHAWVACCFVTPELSHDWLLHGPMRSLLQMFSGQKQGTLADGKLGSEKPLMPRMLKNFHSHVM